jgi:peptidoglycan hydrolase CwlO-like protein
LLARRTLGVAAFTAALAVVVALILAATAASSPSEVRTRRKQAQLVLAQVRQLGAEVGAAAERWNGARLRLQTLQAELRATRIDLGRARSGYRVAQRRASERLVALYTGGASPSAIEIVLGAAVARRDDRRARGGGAHRGSGRAHRRGAEGLARARHKA